MTRPNQSLHNKHSDNNHAEGYCKVCGHKTKSTIVIGPSQLNQQHTGEKYKICKPCREKKHASKSFAKVAIETLKIKDWSQSTTNTRLKQRLKLHG